MRRQLMSVLLAASMMLTMAPAVLADETGEGTVVEASQSGESVLEGVTSTSASSDTSATDTPADTEAGTSSYSDTSASSETSKVNEPEAMIGNTKYSTLQDAINTIQADGYTGDTTITLIDDIDINNKITVNCNNKLDTLR